MVVNRYTQPAPTTYTHRTRPYPRNYPRISTPHDIRVGYGLGGHPPRSGYLQPGLVIRRLVVNALASRRIVLKPYVKQPKTKHRKVLETWWAFRVTRPPKRASAPCVRCSLPCESIRSILMTRSTQPKAGLTLLGHSSLAPLAVQN